MSTSVLSLPYSQSRPLILAGRLTAPLVAGAYTWDGSAFDASPRADLKAAYLYIVTSISFAADLDAAIAASFTARDGLRATWAYRSLVARNLVLEFIEEQKEVA